MLWRQERHVAKTVWIWNLCRETYSKMWLGQERVVVSSNCLNWQAAPKCLGKVAWLNNKWEAVRQWGKFFWLNSGFQDLALNYSKGEFVYNFTDGLNILPLLERIGKSLISYRTPIWVLLENLCFNYICMLGDCIGLLFRYLDMGLAKSSKYLVLAARCGVLLKKNGSLGQLGVQKCITFLVVHWVFCRLVTAKKVS